MIELLLALGVSVYVLVGIAVLQGGRKRGMFHGLGQMTAALIALFAVFGWPVLMIIGVLVNFGEWVRS